MRGYARVGEVLQVLVVEAEDGDGELEELGGVAFVAEHGGDGVGRHGGVGHEGIGEELDSGAGGDATEDPAFIAADGGGVVDELTVFQLPVRIGGDEGEFVEGFARAFDSADGSF